MLSMHSATLAYAGSAPMAMQARAQTQMSAMDDLKTIAKEQVCFCRTSRPGLASLACSHGCLAGSPLFSGRRWLPNWTP